MPRITIHDPSPEEIRRETKVKSMTKFLSHALRIDKSKLQASFDEYSIQDISFRLMFSGESVHDILLARLKIVDKIVEDFILDNQPWVYSQLTCFLAVKEYSPDETRARMRHERLATHLVKGWPKPDLTVHVMYPIEDLNSEIQGDYLLRAFVTQLGGAVLKKYYDEEFQDELLRVEELQTSHWSEFLKVLLAKLELEGSSNRRLRVFVTLHGARVDQAVQLVRTIHHMSRDWLAPVFQFLISGAGADEIAERVGCEAYELAYPDEYHVQLTKVDQLEMDEEPASDDLAAWMQLKMKGGWHCDVRRMA